MKGCWMRIRWIGCNGAIEKRHNTIEALSISRVQYYPHKFAKTEKPRRWISAAGFGGLVLARFRLVPWLFPEELLNLSSKRRIEFP